MLVLILACAVTVVTYVAIKNLLSGKGMTIGRATMNCRIWISAAIMSAVAIVPALTQSLPDAIATKGETTILTVHAEGAQVYDCKPGEGGKLSWQFREPVATLIQDGKTVGRHYVGPTWEHADGSRIVGKPVGRANGATQKDIPWLKLEVVEARGTGTLTGVSAVQRINTQGGQIDGACEKAGATLAAPYAADYVFLKK
jgi:hypothetical protein